MPRLRLALLCVGGSDSVHTLRALRTLRQHGLAADFAGPREWRLRMAVSAAAFSRLPLRPVPEPLLFHASLPADCSHRDRSAGRKRSPVALGRQWTAPWGMVPAEGLNRFSLPVFLGHPPQHIGGPGGLRVCAGRKRTCGPRGSLNSRVALPRRLCNARALIFTAEPREGDAEGWRLMPPAAQNSSEGERYLYPC